jgi:hypothetical protein
MKKQNQPSIPSAVINEVRYRLTLVGKPNLGDVNLEISSLYTLKGTCWELLFSSGIRVTYHMGLGKIVAIDDDTDKTTLARQQAGEPVTIPKEQVNAIASDYIQKLGWSLAEYQQEGEPSIERNDILGNDNIEPGIWEWDITYTRYVNGIRVQPSFKSVRINPYTGKLCSWSNRDQGDCIPNATSNMISASQALSIATQAYVTGGGTASDPHTPVVLQWEKFDRRDDYYRLGYRLAFTPKNSQGEDIAYIASIIDAENGSIWYMKNILVSISTRSWNSSKIKKSPVISLIESLGTKNDEAAFRRALLMGIPQKKVNLPKSTDKNLLFYTQKEKKISFLFVSVKRELIWETETKGKWAGVKLSKDEAERLSKWLKTAKL